ncbi:MAG TPA: hypothetical protein VGO78_21480 [Acidimicrobiales bacterium]|nr:hypothetical protein [Acidimicrobiales bacterium]
MTPRSRPWWHGVEVEAADPEATTPDDVAREPWADQPLDVAALTPAQRAALAGLDDQPPAPHLDGVAALSDESSDQPSVPRLRPGTGTGTGTGPGNGTGSAPGDPVAADPHSGPRWMEQEQEG